MKLLYKNQTIIQEQTYYTRIHLLYKNLTYFISSAKDEGMRCYIVAPMNIYLIYSSIFRFIP